MFEHICFLSRYSYQIWVAQDMSTVITPPNIGEILTGILSDPRSAIVVLVQFFLGVALGYISVKALKYILAFIAILILGSLLSIWTLETSTAEVLKVIRDVIGVVRNLAVVLGLLAIGPISIGFIVGVVAALLRK